MTETQKKEIQAKLLEYIGQFDSQAKAVVTLNDVSEATVINIKTGKWANVSAEMWRKVGKQVGWHVAGGGWNLVETLDFTTLITYFADAKDYSNVFAITGAAGSGKTFTAEWYASSASNVFHLACAEYWNRKQFLGKLLQKMGVRDAGGLTVSELMDTIVDALLRMDSPLIILDEADKLNDNVLYFFITLYNLLKGRCGLVLMATEYLNTRITRGNRLNKKGYAEILSRIGRRFVKLQGTNREEVTAICQANGMTALVEISEAYNDYEGDLRRVERLVHKSRRLQAKNA